VSARMVRRPVEAGRTARWRLGRAGRGGRIVESRRRAQARQRGTADVRRALRTRRPASGGCRPPPALRWSRPPGRASRTGPAAR
jgi:hypothetical protein